MNDRKAHRGILLVLLFGALSALARAQYSPIYSLNANVDGGNAYYGDILAQGTDGYVYGTLPSGGPVSSGAWFQEMPGSIPTIFPMRGNGSNLPNTGLYGPSAGFSLGIDGNLYGGVEYTSSSSYGAVLKMSGGVVSKVYQFLGGANGSFPKGAPVQGTDGNLYGVTCDYGSTGYVYQIVMSTTPASLGWIHQLPGCSRAPLFLATDGNLYGTYSNGSFVNGAPSSGGFGGIFGISYSGAFLWSYNMNPNSALNSGRGDGQTPTGGVMQANDGRLYGTAKLAGGAATQTPTGVIFTIATDGTGYNVIHYFQTADGTQPEGGLVQGTDGYLYGLASQDGVLLPIQRALGYAPAGTLFKVQLNGTNFTRIFTFTRNTTTGQGSGSNPAAIPLLHTTGDLYGMTYSGGTPYNGANGAQSGGYDDSGELFKYHTGMTPFINTVGRRWGTAGKFVNIIGQGFLNTTNVTFGGTPVSTGSKLALQIWSDTYMTVQVPNFAHTGPIVVTETNASGVQTTLSTTWNFRICSFLSYCP